MSNTNISALPIEHLSYSALSEYLSNRWLFKKHYILHDWSGKESNPAWVVGKGFHKTLEMRYSGLDLDKAMQKGYEELESEARNVDWSRYKTITIEKCKKEMAQAVQFYFEEEPNIGDVLDTEKTMLVDFEINGEAMPLPIKGVVDVVSKVDDELHLWDYKTVTSLSGLESEQQNYILQSMFYYYLVERTYKQAPKVMHFIEIKKSKNRDNTPQVQVYDIEYAKHPEYFRYFSNLYNGVLYELGNPELLYLPNLRDMFNSEETWQDFTMEVMDFAQPAQVSHKSVMDVNVDKTAREASFVQSKEPSTPEEQIMAKLLEFGVPLEFADKHIGPNVTMYTFKPSRGVKMSKISSFEDDLALALGAESVRVEAPIKGKKLVGVEVSNNEQATVNWTNKLLRQNTLSIPIGRDVYGEDILLDLAKAPHMLVAGATGSGKSVFLNNVIHTLTEQTSPDELGLVLIDPKMTEFAPYNELPHLVSDVLIESVDIYKTLEWLVNTMNERYSMMKEVGAVNIDSYNEKGASLKKLVVIVDELSDLMLNPDTVTEKVDPLAVLFGTTTPPKEINLAKAIEKLLVRIAQKSRAAGIHLVLATQRPSVNVVTGILKANLPTRVAFMTSSSIDSQVILDQNGAEKLLGNGDLLLMNPRKKNLQRLQGYYL